MENFSPFKYGTGGRDIPLALTYDDILMVPQHSDIDSRNECSLKTRFSRNVPLNIPIVSSPMDTVTEAEMAKELARNGGIGIIHRFMSIEEQAKQIEKVKRAEAFILTNPVIIKTTDTFKRVKEIIEEAGVSTFLVTDNEIAHQPLASPSLKRKQTEENADCKYNLAGILTKRDIKKFSNDSELVSVAMTSKDKLITWTLTSDPPNPKFFLKLMIENKIEKVPVIDKDNNIKGIICLKDLENSNNRPEANKDPMGRLYVGAAVGAKDDYLERAEKLVEAGVDVLVVDVANGHSDICINAVKALKARFPNTDVVAGSIATGEGALNLIKAGADGIRCGIGNGSICITRVVSGAGVPQFTALTDVAPVCKEYGIPLISDGGNKNSGNMCKALAIGASAIMLGRLLAGCDESPSSLIYRDNKIQKVYRGMAGYGANLSKAQRSGQQEPATMTFSAEGVEGYIPYAGPVNQVLNQFCSGIRSGMSYTGARSLDELRLKVRFIRISSSGKTESGVHSINKI